MMQSTPPNLYMNMSQFSELKLGARQHSAEAGKAAAQQFEGLFVQMMLKDMRAAAKVDDGQHSSYMDFYTDMYDKQIALMLSQSGGIGIAKVIEQQLNRHTGKGQEDAGSVGKQLPVYRVPQATVTQQLPLSKMEYVSPNPAVKAHELAQTRQSESTTQVQKHAALQSETIQPFAGWASADDFVSDLWPAAESAAARLGVSAQVLVAQSALETGWGQHAMRKPDGNIAFNLFGIKASRGWTGPSVQHNTLEFREGAMQQEKAHFRAYDSVREALDDYVSFIQSSPRYDKALQATNDESYIQELQSAGYATDPHYANKIINIMQGQTFNQALASVERHASHVLS